MPRATWIFGYGSLVWRPDFSFAERRSAWLEGFTRRFWQGSTDHRGRPGAPGRVVTLVRDGGVRCAGVAYRLEESRADGILADLDHRERGGYDRLEVELATGQGRVAGLLYLASHANPNYLGPAPLPDIAAQVRGAEGPSGTNLEYVLRLAAALREIGAEDPHVFELEALVSGSPGEPTPGSSSLREHAKRP